MNLAASFGVLCGLLIVVYGNGQDICYNGTYGASCQFYEDTCYWQSHKWKRSRNCSNHQSKHCVNLDSHVGKRGSLWSPPLCSTQSKFHCLQFDYEFKDQDKNGTKLSVVLHFDNERTKKVWELATKDAGVYIAGVPLQTMSHFKIELRAERPQWHSPSKAGRVTIEKIKYNASRCILSPPHAKVAEASQTTDALSTTTTTTTTKATTTATAATPAETTSGEDQKPSAVPSTIIGVVVALAVVIIIVFVVIMVVRRRQIWFWKTTNGGTSQHASPEYEEAQLVERIRRTGTAGTAVSTSVPDNHHYSAVDYESFHINNSSSNNNSISYNSNNPSGSSQATPPISAAMQKLSEGSKPGNRNGKDADDTTNQSTNGAASPTQTLWCSGQGEYKKLNFNRGLREKSATKLELREGEGDLYNHLESVNNMAAATTGRYSADAGKSTAGTGASSRQPETGLNDVRGEDLDSPRPHQNDRGDEAYNCLDFAGQRAGPSESIGDGEGGCRKVYDHLQVGGQDT